MTITRTDALRSLILAVAALGASQAMAAAKVCGTLAFAPHENDLNVLLPELLRKGKTSSGKEFETRTEIVPLGAAVDELLTETAEGTAICVTGRLPTSGLRKYLAFGVELSN